MPKPVLVIPAVDVWDITLEIVKSAAAFTLSPIVNVRVAAPRLKPPTPVLLMVEPRGLFVALYVMPPFAVRIPPAVVTLAALVVVVPARVRTLVNVSAKPFRSNMAVMPAPVALTVVVEPAAITLFCTPSRSVPFRIVVAPV